MGGIIFLSSGALSLFLGICLSCCACKKKSTNAVVYNDCDVVVDAEIGGATNLEVEVEVDVQPTVEIEVEMPVVEVEAPEVEVEVEVEVEAPEVEVEAEVEVEIEA